MKLSAAELARFAELAERHGANRTRAVPGQPGCRERPLSYVALLHERRRALGRDDA
ncbi:MULTISPECIES: hypothetical protein [unclassified Novosphingobium]|uniref:hypothetical protein n=1 Tax=unclassified Novosphingobium TaxID=2644732 RepID=UPI002600197F|nr:MULTISPECIES: hypothetical protein [unclassified Novosphingobium]HQV02275.1 hypothetical protein [Novosphingobium sp.]